METLGFIIASGVFSFLGRSANKLGWSGLESVSNIVFGGALEEILEKVVERIFPNSALYFRHRRKNKREMLKEITEYVNSLSPEKKDELYAYIASHEFRAERDGKSDIIWKDTGDKNSEEIFKKKFAKAVKKALGGLENAQQLTVHFKDPEELAADVFVGGEDAIPEIIEIIAIINRHVFEIKYLSLGAEERDLVKVIQYMIEDSSALRSVTAMTERMEDFFALITQQNANPAFNVLIKDMKEKPEVAIGKIDTLSKKDPFLFVQLKCPSCSATGGNVVRQGDRAFCRHCGNTYDIIRNDETVIDALMATERKITSRIEESGVKVTEDIKREIERLSSKTVSVEYFNAYMAAATASDTARDAVLLKSIEGLQNAIDGKIEDSLGVIGESIRSMSGSRKSDNEMIVSAIKQEANKASASLEMIKSDLGKVGEKIGKVDEKVGLTLDVIMKLRDEMGQASRERKADSEEMVSAIIAAMGAGYGANKKLEADINKLLALITVINDTPRGGKKPEDVNSSVSVSCPHCHRHGLEMKLSRGVFRCTCGYTIPESEIQNAHEMDRDYEFIIEHRFGRLALDIYRPSRTSDVRRRIAMGSVPRICIVDSVMGKINHESAALERGPSATKNDLFNTESIILVGDGGGLSVGDHIAPMLNSVFSNLKEIIFGEGVCYKAPRKQSREWVYNSHDHVLRRKS